MLEESYANIEHSLTDEVGNTLNKHKYNRPFFYIFYRPFFYIIGLLFYIFK